MIEKMTDEERTQCLNELYSWFIQKRETETLKEWRERIDLRLDELQKVHYKINDLIISELASI